MNLSLFEFIARKNIGDIEECLLLPALSSEQRYSSLYSAITLTMLCRLRRERPYVIASFDWQSLQGEDLYYAHSLPKLQISVLEETKTVFYIGQGDVSAFLPRSEEDFLLLLPEPPSAIILSWPTMITKLNGILVGQSDDFIKLQTVDHAIVTLVERFLTKPVKRMDTI